MPSSPQTQSRSYALLEPIGAPAAGPSPLALECPPCPSDGGAGAVRCLRALPLVCTCGGPYLINAENVKAANAFNSRSSDTNSKLHELRYEPVKPKGPAKPVK